MMQISENIAYVLNSVGLCIDIIGAWFVAWEITSQYKRGKI